ncbi:transposase [Schaalia sp. Marseille-Q2122]|uniref:transposase n=1 Tax=Schaalia sp. Marseille-Q2122 TaxID=2736604 RepID=UPI00158BB44B
MFNATFSRFFLTFARTVQQVIYSIHGIESLNYRLRKIVRTRGIFPSAQATLKLLRLLREPHAPACLRSHRKCPPL